MSVFFGHTVGRMQDELSRPDETAVIILKGHLLVEEHLNRIIDVGLPHPEKLEKERFRYVQLLQIVRSVAPADHPMFDLIVHLNSLRNHLAHSLAGEKRRRKVEEFLRKFLELHPPAASVSIVESGIEANAVACAIGYCLGFLAALEETLVAKSGDT